MFSIRFARDAVGDLEALDTHVRSRILMAIEERLTGDPLTRSRNRKQLAGLVPPWHQVRPVWELRVGEHRVFYDADPAERAVVVQAIRHKGRRTTEEIL